MSTQPKDKDNSPGRVREADKALTFAPPTPGKPATDSMNIEFHGKLRATEMRVEDKLTGDQWTVKLDFSQPPGMRETLARKPGDENHDYWRNVWVLSVGDDVIQESHFPKDAA